ncbi:MAG TPA: P-II family nitrogen regulator [Gammaproteobacteria bacterium]|nr:P-II family nitrogen regulator [Gammaproteobacteria bacterium]
MNYQKVTAIIRCDVLEKVEQKLCEIGIGGISVTKVKGYGEYANFYAKDWMGDCARIDIFTPESKTDKIVQAILDTAHLGMEGDGIVAVSPVEQFYRIRTREKMG